MLSDQQIRSEMPNTVFKVMRNLGGSAHYRTINEEVFRIYGESKSTYWSLGFARRALKDAGIVISHNGIWSLTETGKKIMEVDTEKVWAIYDTELEKRRK